MQIPEAVKKAREGSKARKFRQSFDLSINISGLDMKKPENRISKEVMLPNGRGKEAKVCLISDSQKYENCITGAEMNSVSKDKRKIKALARKYDFFMSDPQLMVSVGKSLGKYLGPLGKMPRVLPPNVEAAKIAEQLQKSVRIRIKDSPVIHCIVGSEDMKDSDIEANAAHVLEEVRNALPGKGIIKSAYIKLTMGGAVRIDV